MGSREQQEAFVRWLKSRGGYVHPSLDLFHPLPSGDRGVIATKDIAEGEQLVLVPQEATVYLPSDEDFKKSPSSYSPCVAYLKALQPPPAPFAASCLLLMHVLAQGGAGPLAAYCATLPDKTDCLLHWSEEERAELKGTSLEGLAHDVDETYARDIAPHVAARPDLWPAGPSTDASGFRHAAGLVQSRAFHMRAENWVTGASTEGSDLFLIPAIDMINHASDPARRNSSLLRLSLPMTVDVEGGGQASFTGFFTMKAESPIPQGGQVLHSYGDQADAQLLHVFGFVDGLGEGAAAGPGPGSSSSSSSKFVNPHNYALLPLAVVLRCCRQMVQDNPEDYPPELEASKLQLLADCGLLHKGAAAVAAASAATAGSKAAKGKAKAKAKGKAKGGKGDEGQQQQASQDAEGAGGAEQAFVLTQAEPLPDKLLTVVQVMLMSGEEFKQLAKEWGQHKGAGQEGSGKAPPSLGRALLQSDQAFAEGVCYTLVEVVTSCLSRYPTSVKDDVRLLARPGLPFRQRCAMAVRLGEKDVLALAKKQAVVLMMEGLRKKGGPAAKKQKGPTGKAVAQEDEDDEDEDDEDEDEDEDDEDEDDEGDEGEDEDEDDDIDEDERGLLDSDDSDKVGYGPEDFDDGIGEGHDRGKAHPLPKD